MLYLINEVSAGLQISPAKKVVVVQVVVQIVDDLFLWVNTGSCVNIIVGFIKAFAEAAKHFGHG